MKKISFTLLLFIVPLTLYGGLKKPPMEKSKVGTELSGEVVDTSSSGETTISSDISKLPLYDYVHNPKNLPIYKQIIETPFMKELAKGILPRDKYYSYLMQDAYFLYAFGTAHKKAAELAPRPEIKEYLQSEEQKSKRFSFDVASQTNVDPTDESKCLPYCQTYIAQLNPPKDSPYEYAYRLGALLTCPLLYFHLAKDIKERPDPSSPGYEHSQGWFATNENKRFDQKIATQIRIFTNEYENLSPDERDSFDAGFFDAMKKELEFFQGAYSSL